MEEICWAKGTVVAIFFFFFLLLGQRLVLLHQFPSWLVHGPSQGEAHTGDTAGKAPCTLSRSGECVPEGSLPSMRGWGQLRPCCWRTAA